MMCKTMGNMCRGVSVLDCHHFPRRKVALAVDREREDVIPAGEDGGSSVSLAGIVGR